MGGDPACAPQHLAHVGLNGVRDPLAGIVHAAMGGIMLGSVSQHCVQHATCPVVVVR